MVIATISLALLLLPGLAQAEPVDDAAAQCKALGSVDFSHIPDAPAQIIEAKVVKDNGDAHEFCEINGYVEPSVGFLLRLPLDSWNGKFMEFGCGGFCGSTEHIQKCNDPLRRGYACIVSDAGHRSTALDGKWAYNNPQAQIDFGYRSTHVTALVGKAITERFYGRAPDHSYFHGCSTGGRQGLMEAQRFPWDFDGVIAGAPVVSGPAIGMSLLWTSLALRDKTGEPLLRQIDLEVLHDAVVAKCDLNDGVKDGLIGDPRACSFDPSVLLCNESKKTRCLTAKQVSAVSKLYGSPVTSKGEAIYAPGVLPGSERTWLDWDPRALIADAFRYFYFRPAPGPSWNVGDFDFDRDYKRLGMGEVGTAADNPDLRKYKAAGGKLLSYMGWSDSGVTPLAAVDYYETAERTMGGRAATQEFFRLFRRAQWIDATLACSLAAGVLNPKVSLGR